MNRFKDILNKGSDDEKRIKRSFVRYAIVLTALMLAFFLFKTDNIFRWIEAGITVSNRTRYGRRNITTVQAAAFTPNVWANISISRPVAKPIRYCTIFGSSSGKSNNANR